MPRRRRECVSLSVITLDGASNCDGCLVNLPAGEVVIHFDGNPEPYGPARDFCVECISGVAIEASTVARFQHRAKPITIRIRSQRTNEVVDTIELKGGSVVARRLISGLCERIDFDQFWVDLSELETREERQRNPGKKGS